MTILFVFNGAFNFRSPTEWSLDHIIAAAASPRKRKITGEEDDEENVGNLRGGRGSHGKKSRR